jgi:hypothetical protein
MGIIHEKVRPCLNSPIQNLSAVHGFFSGRIGVSMRTPSTNFIKNGYIGNPQLEYLKNSSIRASILPDLT